MDDIEENTDNLLKYMYPRRENMYVWPKKINKLTQSKKCFLQ